MAKRKSHYINNKDLFKALCEHKQMMEDAAKKGEPSPQIPNYIGECILAMSTRIASKPCFSGYTYKEEMIADGIKNCIQTIARGNIDPTRPNVFAYFTQIIYNSFFSRISKEKKQAYIKYDIISEAGLGQYGDDNYSASSLNISDYDIEKREREKAEKKKKTKKKVKKKKSTTRLIEE